MLETEKDITDAVDGRWKDLLELRNRIENDYALWRLEKFTFQKEGTSSKSEDKEYDIYTTNEPRNLANKIIEILANAPKQIRIPLEKENEEERNQLSDAERFIYGCLNLADSRLLASVQPSIQEQMAFFATLRGWYATRVFIHTKEEGGLVIPDIKIWDIMHTSWEVGDGGLSWACHRRPATKSQIKAEWNIDITGKNAFVYDFWDKEKNAVVIENKFAEKPEKEHGLDHTPVLISMVGATPLIQSERFTDTIKDSGESIYASNRNIYEPLSKLMTYYLTIVGTSAHNPIALYSSGGKKSFQKSPYYKGSVVQFDVDKNEKAELLVKPEVPREIGALLGAVGRESTVGGASPVLYGLPEFGESGRQTQLLTYAASTILTPRQKSMESSYEWIARELLTQYAGGGFGKLRLHGRDGSNEAFDMELSSDGIKGDWFPEVKLMPTLPENKLENYTMAQMAVQNRLLSRQTAMDKHLGVQDTDAENEKILRETAESIPSVMVRELAKALVNDGKPEAAMALMDEFARTGMGEQGAKPASEAVEPQFAQGARREVLPSEEMGKTQ